MTITMTPSVPKLITKNQLAEIFSVTPRAIDDMVRDGRIAKPMALGSGSRPRLRWRLADVEKLIAGLTAKED